MATMLWMAQINPHINFNGNAEEAFHFYKSVFCGEFTKIIRLIAGNVEFVGVPTKRLIAKASPRNRRSSYKECLLAKASPLNRVPTKCLLAKASPRNRGSSYKTPDRKSQSSKS